MDMLFGGDGEGLWTAKCSEVVPHYRCNIGMDPDDEKVWQKGVYTTTTRRGAGVATAARCSSLAVASLVLGSPVPEADPSPAAYASDYAYYLPAPASAPSSQYHAQVCLNYSVAFSLTKFFFNMHIRFRAYLSPGPGIRSSVF